jgi:peroxin-10
MAIRFPFAEQPDIIRAAQKDEFYQRVLTQQVNEVSVASLGPRTASKYKDEFALLSDLFYYGVSSLLGTINVILSLSSHSVRQANSW